MCDMFELKCFIQNYHWGKKGLDSEVCRLGLAGGHINIVDEKQFYAELWMGALSKGMSIVKNSGLNLNKWIDFNHEALGETSIAKFGKNLPFLLKVLSINSALSIQVHPDKDMAEKLHQEYPEVYQDPNHKPEIAIALSNFEGLCGFRPYAEIKMFLVEIPEFQDIIGLELLKKLKEGTTNENDIVKNIFYKLMTSDKKIIKQNITSHKNKINKLDAEHKKKYLAKLFCQLDCWYPGDVGCFCIYFLNYIKLTPGQAIYLGANVPHAYIYGDCIECMACSDNVVRAGLTSKNIDVETLCNITNFDGAPAELKLFYGVSENNYTTLFKPPVPDFSVAHIMIPPNITCNLITRRAASIIIVINGQCKVIGLSELLLSTGKVIFVPAKLSIQICTYSENVHIYQAFANL
ncbi:mannose-6-phosphate isomerase [Daktulosphaira vitifoliae]|uniref:mannose-6-phosphate isomerase n=1 Tax=Daktulosphaira vitifoliae TaxID=58002 RepID=UPI0021A9D2B0|nr:mannose-6-phosphate isomerase [Daktulosphaira vitifoliae]